MSKVFSQIFSRQYSVRSYLAATIFCTIIPFSAFFIFYINGLWVDGLDHAHDRAYVEAEKVSADIYGQIRDRREILAELSVRPEIAKPNSQECDQTLKLYQQTFPDLAAVTIRSVSGEPLCSSWPRPRQIFPSPLPRWFAEAVNANGFYVTNAVFGPTSRRWVIGLTYPIRDRNGLTKSILIFSVDLLKLNQRLLAGPYGHTVVSVTDRNFNVILRSHGLADWIGRPLPKRITDIYRARGNGTFRTLDIYNQKRIGAYVTVPLVDWVVAEGYPESEMLAPTMARIQNAAILGAVMIIALFFVAFSIYRKIVEYCRALANTAEQIRLGNLGARAACDGPKELALVAHQFNLMLDSLQEQNANLLHVNSALSEIIEAMRPAPPKS